jgi:1,4-alpha-glucan branching enzyme
VPASQEHIDDSTPLGATLWPDGTTFRCWAPSALDVYLVLGHVAAVDGDDAETVKLESQRLLADDNGIWSGFFPGVGAGEAYRFYVVGTGSEGFKRDPYARELARSGYPNCGCIVRSADAYPWSAPDFKTPELSELVVYQFHFGVFYAEDEQGRDIRPHRVCKFLDAVGRIEYWADLGINAVMPLPFQEFQTENSLGYNGTDLFSPEMDYSVPEAELAPYRERVNRLRAAKGKAALPHAGLSGQVNQLKTFIDLCHLYGIAVIADVVYNHAGGSFDDQSLYFFDRQPPGDNARSLYFTREGHAGGLIFDYEKPEVCRLLLDNALSLLEEYRIDGLRYDQVTVMDEHGGWFFCQELSQRVRAARPRTAQIAEYWGAEPWRAVAHPPAGMGFDIGYSDVLRQSIRGVIAQAAHGASARVDLDSLRDALAFTQRLPGRWTTFQCIENHDLLDVNHDDKQPRIARLADASDARSWYARSRARVASGLLLTAPGVPQLFMGQEFLEDKYWTDWQGRPELLLWWAGVEGADRHMADHYRFMRDLIALRRRLPALHADGLNVFHVHDDQRILAFQRWVPGVGQDVVVVMSLNEATFYDGSYCIGFPAPGYWREVFNSDAYDRFLNPDLVGNFGGVTAVEEPRHGLPASAGISIPANSLLIFTRES